ncbi:hypothetical protein BYT27DRAFT_7179514 [Phlegmacium glaucopus]|nr:hypothetical protein BYT27DRAFT_7179514 [Phlegmacium glaucopus]
MKLTSVVNVFILFAAMTVSVISEHQDTNSFDIVDQTIVDQTDTIDVDHNDGSHGTLDYFEEQDSDSEDDMAAVSCSLKNKNRGTHCEVFTCIRGGGRCAAGRLGRCSGKNLTGRKAPFACLACKCTRDRG